MRYWAMNEEIIEIHLPAVGMSDLLLELAGGFGDWLAGFIDGEGCFMIQMSPTQGRKCKFEMTLRQDDGNVLEEIRARTGLGSVRHSEAYGNQLHPTSRLVIVSKDDCAALVRILDLFPLRAKKARDFAIWREAVSVLADKPSAEREERLVDLKAQLHRTRAYA